MKNKLLFSVFFTLTAFSSFSTHLVSVHIVDKDYIMLYFRDGDVTFNERKIVDWQTWELYHNGPFLSDINSLETYGVALNTSNVAISGNWKISSADDVNFGGAGISPSNVYRKSKLGCMAQMGWNNSTNDFNYDWAYEHTVFLKLSRSLEQGKTYTIEIPSNINSDITTHTITFDIFNSRSEAVKTNIVGYSTENSIKSADVYLWLGDGGARDYSSFVGKKIYVYNVETQEKTEIGTLSLWKTAAGETGISHQMLQSAVWKADFTGFSNAGIFRLAIEDIGCSEDFEIRNDIYYAPFKVATQGFYYMRIGEDSKKSGISPIARQPLYIPEVSPANCKVIITTMQPYHAQWLTIPSDQWDNPDKWAPFAKAGNPTNPNAYGGHSDAMDWDRHLGHVSTIYDMLLPYYLSQGKISDDNLGIAESGNGIPDLLDEARNEIDFWLRLRDGKGYSHGVTCPTENTNIFYQAGNTAVAAWANAANAAMLADCFRLSGHTDLMHEYQDSAIMAYNYANSLPDKQLTRSQDMGDMTMNGNDLKITAAAFLYNLTGNTAYENDFLAGSRCTLNSSQVFNSSSCELYALAAYLMSNRTIHNQVRYDNMKNSVIAEAKSKETNYSGIRPSRRSTNEDSGWFVTSIHNQRSIVAHAISAEGSADKQLFEDALILEADFSLGRNPLNAIHMTTATTELANKKSFENAYTSGWNDGVEGVHPGHTPYMNIYDWFQGMVMGAPQWMVEKNYPAVVYNNPGNPSEGIQPGSWAIGELYYNTRYVYAANEFTPQQTMRGKIALYAYLYSLSNTEHIHDFSDWKINTAATCTEDGEKIEKCAICGEIGTKTEVIPAIGEHNFVWQTTIPATCTSTGEQVEVCSVCGATGVTEIITMDCQPLIVTVINGTSDKNRYFEGETVTINANIAVEGNNFQHWTSQDVTFADPFDISTTFTMPAHNVMVTAEFETVGIKTIAEERVTIYPNPARETITVEGLENGAIFQIYNATGRVVEMLPATSLQGGLQTINISHLPQGIYCIVSCGKKALFVKQYVNN